MKCKYCGYSDTEICETCAELECYMKEYPEIAKQIIKEIEGK